MSTPQDRLEARLADLRAELVSGERALAEIDSRRERLVASMLRIGGAIQVLAELVAEPGSVPAPVPAPVHGPTAGRQQAVPSEAGARSSGG